MIFETINKQESGDLLGEYAEGLTNDRNLLGGKAPGLNNIETLEWHSSNTP